MVDIRAMRHAPARRERPRADPERAKASLAASQATRPSRLAFRTLWTPAQLL